MIAQPLIFRPLMALAVTFTATFIAFAADSTRQPSEDVDRAKIRQRQGLVPGPAQLFNGWGVTPAGSHVPISDLALKLVVAPDNKTVAGVCAGYNNTGLVLLDIAGQKVRQFIPLEKCWNGLAFSKDGKRIFVSGSDSGEIHAFKFADGIATALPSVKPAVQGPVFFAAIAVHPGTGKLYVCNEANHEILVLNSDTLALEKTIPVGLYPHTCIFGGDKQHLYVSNWGGRSVTVLDTATGRRVRDITVGIRPNDMALAPDGRLFVACAGDNTVHVIATRTVEKAGPDASPARRLWEGTREIISTSLYPQSPEGSTPDALAISPDGKTLFVANADNNSVLVADITTSAFEEARKNNESISLINGFIPVGWYPSAIAVSPDNKTLMVANGKGLTSRANFPATDLPRNTRSHSQSFPHIGTTLAGSVSFISRPDAAQMVAYTEQVRKNSPYTPESYQRAPIKSDSVIPDQVGAPCPIKYVLYIIKENRTYDQMLGDMTDAKGRPIGNGEPKLAIYGEKISPNHHQIARDYVLFDNLYCNGEVSADGHSWCDAAIATDFNQRSWILSYSKHGRLTGNEEMENPSAGYLWDLCKRHGVSYKNYGEGAQRVPSVNRGNWHANWRDGRDKDLVDNWITDLHEAEKSGKLPRFTIMSLGEDHTQGTSPGAYTPEACVASNDLGLGKIIAAATRSKFWKEMAIFVIEDDAQNGPDHVDAHRTAGFIISPYTKRNFVDSTLYTTASMIRTMELILGLPPLTQYDAGATPMFNAFTRTAKVTPYTVLTPDVDLNAKNTRASLFSRESAKMNFKEYDRAPEDQLNRILWHAAKGLDTPYPTPIHGVIFPK